MKIEITTSLFGIEKSDDGQFFAVRDSNPRFCLIGDTPEDAAARAQELLESYEDMRPETGPVLSQEEIDGIARKRDEFTNLLIKLVSSKDVLFMEAPLEWVKPPQNRGGAREEAEDPHGIRYWGWRFHDMGSVYFLNRNMKTDSFELRRYPDFPQHDEDPTVIFTVYPPETGKFETAHPWCKLKRRHQISIAAERNQAHLRSLQLCREAENLRHSLSVKFKDKK